MPFYHGYMGASWPTLDEPMYCSYCRRRHRTGATQCEGRGAPVTREGSARRTAWSDSGYDEILIGARVNDETGATISAEEWAANDWIDVTTFGAAERRYVRGRAL